MFIDFEGIDGSGKTTLSNLLASRLKKLGYKVAHAREGGELQSPTARRIRELTRDAKLLEMCPRAEFFLNLARDAQQLDEVIAPALKRGEVCITDRYLYSQLALTGGGRGLKEEQLLPSCELASQGLWPDLVILVDVDPDLARLRKRLGKVQSGKANDSDSRKGLVGAGLAVRVREAFLAQARKDPSRWIILENNDQPLRVLEQRLVEAVVARLEGREQPVQRLVPAPSLPSCVASVDDVEERFFQAVDALEAREPQLAAWLLNGIPGLPAHQRRLAYAERLPGLVARSLNGLEDDTAWTLRDVLSASVPADVAEGLGFVTSPRSHALRQRLYAQAPAAVLEGLKRQDSPEAWALRERGVKDGHLAAVLLGLAGVDGDESWVIREAGMQRKLYSEVARSLGGLTTERAEALREALIPHDRLAVLKSTTGLETPVAVGLREQLEKGALKLVLRSLTGVDTPRAWAMRERGAALTKEALDSVDGMDSPAAWKLRASAARRWPATVVSSMRGLPLVAETRALLDRILEEQAGKLPVLRNAYAVVAQARALEQAQRPARALAETLSVDAGRQEA
ncbi:dTMP kinase [Corallococcus sp. AB049A]|uniref:dTMP kinase n=1 Tax=Corallococcus sp. AB049A TaxID=2316721 RepID=UPI000EE0C34A|nr:dTMP kinase [Corallococcus sp. AB049A]RKI52996.1 dTMP kinase [Corallococcus sp. AB049A]